MIIIAIQVKRMIQRAIIRISFEYQSRGQQQINATHTETHNV